MSQLNMKKFLFSLAIATVVIGTPAISVHAGFFDWVYTIFSEPLFGAPVLNYSRTIFPEVDSTYELGTTTQAWLRTTTDEICLTGDTCYTSLGTASALNDLTDVTLSLPTNGQVLKYNGSAWVNDTDLTGGGGAGSGTVSTSTALVDTYITYATSASTIGAESAFTYDDSTNLLTLTGNASTTQLSATTLYGALVGNADTATSLASNGTNASAGNAILGVDASGNAEGAFDVWTEAENTAAAYISDITGENLGDLSDVGAMGASSTVFTTNGTNASWQQIVFGVLGGLLDLATQVTGTLDESNIDADIARDSELHNAVTLAGQDYLTISTQQITAGEIEPDDLAASDFGDFSCNGTNCSLDATYLTGNETITLSGDVTGSGATSITTAIADDVVDFTDINYGLTLAGNPALAVDECYFAKTTSGGGFICEGSTADTSEQLYLFPDVNGSDTTSRIFTDDSTITAVDDTSLEVNSSTLRRAALTGDITASAGSNTTAIGTGVIVNADVNASAAIAYSKLSLTNALLEADLKAVNTAVDEDILTYESTTGDFEWHTPTELDLVSVASPSNGDILYYNSGWQKLGIGSDGQVLKISSSLPSWGTDSTGGGGGDFAWTTETNYGETVNSTSTPLWLKDTLYASSTSFFSDLVTFGNATGTQLTLTDLFISGDQISDFAGTGLSVTGGVLNAEVQTADLHDAVTLAGSLDYLTLSGQQITRNAIDLTTDTTGTLAVASGGTGAATLTDGGVLLGSGTGAITALGVLSDGHIIVGDGTTDPTTLQILTASNGTLRHEVGGLEADVSLYSGLLAISGGSTSEIDSKSELEGQIADVSDFAEADGDTYSGTHDFSGSLLRLPLDATLASDGDIHLDTTSGQLQYYASSTRVLFYEEDKSLRIGSSTPDDSYNIFSTATTTWDVWNPKRAVTATDLYCKTETAGTVFARVGDGTNWTPEVQATASGAGISLSTNNTFSAREDVIVEIGTSASSPDAVTCTVTFALTAD